MTTERHAEEQHWPARRKQRQPTIDELVLRILQRRRGGRLRVRQGRGGKPARPPRVRLVHRLDRDTSGVMVLAVSVEAERLLVQMFRKHVMHRVYYAIAQGRVEAGTLDSSLVRDRGDRRRGSTRLPKVGKRAVTHVRPLEYLDGYTLVECRLETGRTHQIRIHLAEAGHPLCGEKVYNKPLFGKPTVDHSGAQRQALHAAESGFSHPVTGEEMMFKTPLPADMERLLVKLRRDGHQARPEFTQHMKPKPVLHMAGENDPLVTFAWQQRTIDEVRKINGCGEGKPWGEHCTMYPSKGGTPVVTYIHSGGHHAS